MELGAFSVSLSVKDLNASKLFYENLGFQVFAGQAENNYLIMKNGETLIGLFQGMFPNNILTFNPGWNQSAGNLDEFDDVRVIQKTLKEKGVRVDGDTSTSLSTGLDENTSGPASFTLTDPDGNVILIDQHR